MDRDSNQRKETLLTTLSSSSSSLEDWTKHIPLGYRFSPTDSEAFSYLLCKVYSTHNRSNINLGVIQDVDVYLTQPCELPGLQKEEEYHYYFSRRDMRYTSKTRINRITRDGKGYWRITSKITEFKEGKKNTLVYYFKSKNEKGKGQKTNWIMHEYVLDHASPTSTDKVNDVVLCRIYERGQEHDDLSTKDGHDDDLRSLRPKRKHNEAFRDEVDESSHGDIQSLANENDTTYRSKRRLNEATILEVDHDSRHGTPTNENDASKHSEPTTRLDKVDGSKAKVNDMISCTKRRASGESATRLDVDESQANVNDIICCTKSRPIGESATRLDVDESQANIDVMISRTETRLNGESTTNMISRKKTRPRLDVDESQADISRTKMRPSEATRRVVDESKNRCLEKVNHTLPANNNASCTNNLVVDHHLSNVLNVKDSSMSKKKLTTETTNIVEADELRGQNSSNDLVMEDDDDDDSRLQTRLSEATIEAVELSLHGRQLNDGVVTLLNQNVDGRQAMEGAISLEVEKSNYLEVEESNHDGQPKNCIPAYENDDIDLTLRLGFSWI